MKQITFAAGLLVLGLALGLAMPRVLAQTAQLEVQKWEQFCELPRQGGLPQKGIAKVNATVGAHGENGYQLVSAATVADSTVLVLCYRRPAQ